MKKRLIAVSSIILALSLLVSALSGCYVPPQRKYYKNLNKDETDSILFYSFTDDIIYSKGVDLDTIEQAEPFCSLEESQFESFLQDLSKMRFYSQGGILFGAVDPSFKFGNLVVKIIFTDGSTLYLSDRKYCVWKNSDGSTREFNHLAPGKEEWVSLINKYIPNS